MVEFAFFPPGRRSRRLLCGADLAGQSVMICRRDVSRFLVFIAKLQLIVGATSRSRLKRELTWDGVVAS